MHFMSDNAAPVPAEVLAAMADAAPHPAAPYGNDPLTARAEGLLREFFAAPEAAVRLVATGTAANALSLATLTAPWQTVFAHRTAHVEEDECGAPEFFSCGARLTLIDGAHGKIDPDRLAAAIAITGKRGVHGVQRGPVTLTNATEAGTVYRSGEIARIGEIARGHGLPLHLDGARIANALVHTGASAADLTWRAGVTIASFGGTKLGAPGVEAVVLFDPDLAREFELRRKRAGHLVSRHVYLAAQIVALMERELWRRLAEAANAAAAALAARLGALSHVRLWHPVEANMVFAEWPRSLHRRLHEAGAHYYMWPVDAPLDAGDDTAPIGARLVTSWATREEEIDRFCRILEAG